MKSKALTMALIMALLFSAIAGGQLGLLTKANFLPSPPDLPHIYIRSDGTVDPSTAPIHRIGNIYFFAENIYNYSVVVQRGNIIIDGAGHTLQGNRSNGIVAKGIDFGAKSNVIVINLEISEFEYGIWNVGNKNSYSRIVGNVITRCGDAVELVNSFHNTIVGNNITGNSKGVDLHWSSYNIIDQNIITNNEHGIHLHASNNTITRNKISDNNKGVVVDWHDYNQIVENEISRNDVGIYFYVGNSTGNIVYHNNFITNVKQVYDENEKYQFYHPPQNNIWDNGTQGNYWSDYIDADDDGDGIGDSQYIVYENMIDNYPLILPTETYSTPSPSPEPTLQPTPEPELVSTTLIATAFGASAFLVFGGLLVYFKKRHRGKSP